MRITAIEIRDYPPIKHFAVEALSDVIVVGGPNGVGKTKLQEAILQKFREPTGHPKTRLQVEATSAGEAKAWGGKTSLDTALAPDARLLQQFLQRPHKRGRLRGGVLNFDSSRMFEEVKPYRFSFDFPDPLEEDVAWETTFNPLRGRFTDTVHSLHRKIRSQKEQIAQKALDLQRQGISTMDLDFGDPLVKFKQTFARLLPGKELVDLDERSQNLQYRTPTGGPFPITSLSSGEREVVGIVFDFLLRDPGDCIVLFDEPEVHLHPELSYRLLHTLREAGERNQFLYCTHSAEIISASLDHTVVFISPVAGDKNQALVMKQESEAGEVLQLLGQSLGIISLGRRIVLIEGERTSLDKQTYGAILKTSYPELVLVPAGGRDNLETFAKAIETVLNSAVWGVDFFVLCDGDASVDSSRTKQLESSTGGRLRRLPRYHLENYFLATEVLARVFRGLGDSPDNWLCNPQKIEEKLRELATPMVSYAAALRVTHTLRLASGNIDVMPKGCDGKSIEQLLAMFEESAKSEQKRLLDALELGRLRVLVETEHRTLAEALSNPGDDWKRLIPGRPILNAFAKVAKIDQARLKTLYIKAARDSEPDPFADIRDIFGAFATYGRRG